LLRKKKLVATLRAAGAVLIAKTNIPQTLLAFESANPLWGRTLNPYSAAHTAGGSSGGEGALLAADGAALGVGTDIGGSIRIPSGYCGIYGLKPGHGRITIEGVAGASVAPVLCRSHMPSRWEQIRTPVSRLSVRWRVRWPALSRTSSA